MSHPDFVDYSDQARSFEGSAAFTSGSVDVSDGLALPERYRCAYLTSAALSVIGQKPLRGRDFQPGDEIPGAAPVTMLSYELWQSRYSGEDSIVGRTLRINDRPTQVIGVLARGVTFPGATDLWLPLGRLPP